MTSTDGLVTMKTEVYPKGVSKTYENSVSIYFDLLSSRQYCYLSSIHILTFSLCGTHASKIFHRWFEIDFDIRQGLPKLFTVDYCPIYKSQPNNNYINISTEIFCLSRNEKTEESLTVPSTANSVEMMYNWIVCDLAALMNASQEDIRSDLFPASDDLVNFHLKLEPTGMFGNRKKHISLFACIDRAKATDGPLILVKSTFTISGYGKGNERVIVGPISYFYNSNNLAALCWVTYERILFKKAIEQQCLTVKYHGFYYIS